MTADKRTAADEMPEIVPLEEHDPTSIAIIEMLQEDGRMPFSKIAKALDVSEGTVRNRVRQLREDNMISIEAQTSPKAFGYHWNSITFVNLAAGVDIDAVARRFGDIAEVYYVVMMTGRFDLGVAAYHKSDADFRAFLTTHCYGREDIAGVEPNINLEIYKLKTKWRIGA